MQENKSQQPFSSSYRLRIACYAIWQCTFFFHVGLVLIFLTGLAGLLNQILFLLVINLYAVWLLSGIISCPIFIITVTSGWGLYCPNCGIKLFTIKQPASILAIAKIPLRYRWN